MPTWLECNRVSLHPGRGGRVPRDSTRQPVRLTGIDAANTHVYLAVFLPLSSPLGPQAANLVAVLVAANWPPLSCASCSCGCG